MTLTADQLDLLRELVNVGIGRAASSLSELVETPIVLRVPEISVGRVCDLEQGWQEKAMTGVSVVSQCFRGASTGLCALALETRSARVLVSVLLGAHDDGDFVAEREAVLVEVGNIVINGVMGTFGNLVDRDIVYGLPAYHDGDLKGVLGAVSGTVVIVNVVLGARDHAIEGELAVVFDASALDQIWRLLDSEPAPTYATARA